MRQVTLILVAMACAGASSPPSAGVHRALDEALSLMPTSLQDDALLARLRRTAIAGDATAANLLGSMYYLGTRVGQNTTEAMEWLRIAASTGNTAAQRSVGLMYREGAGVSPNKREAVQWFLRAAESTGDDVLVERREAQAALCYAFLMGDGVEQNDAVGANWCRKAAQNGDVPSFAWMGRLYFEGRGVPQDLEQSIEWYRRAAGYGDMQAEMQLPDLHERHGKHTERAARASLVTQQGSTEEVSSPHRTAWWMQSACLWGTVLAIVLLGKTEHMQQLLAQLWRQPPQAQAQAPLRREPVHGSNTITVEGTAVVVSRQMCREGLAGNAVLRGRSHEPPPDLCCPISCELFEEPVVAADGTFPPHCLLLPSPAFHCCNSSRTHA